MDLAINAPVLGNNVVDGLNTTDKHYLKGEMELIGKLVSKYNTKIGIIPSASRDVSIKFPDQCLYILDNKEILNGLKYSKKMQKRESPIKYYSRI